VNFGASLEFLVLKMMEWLVLQAGHFPLRQMLILSTVCMKIMWPSDLYVL